jgi:hypothetical protein
MENKFTPGEWIARIDGNFIDVVVNNDSSFGICNIGSHTQLHDADYNIDEAIANANLIAAAPDMLNALQKAFEWAKHMINESHPDYAEITAAILKATK